MRFLMMDARGSLKRLSDQEKEDFLTAVSLRVGKAGETANTKPEEVSEREYSIEEVAEILGISGRTVRRRIAAGELKTETRDRNISQKKDL